MSLSFRPNYLPEALADGFRTNGMTLVHKPLGELQLPTGQLVACDPFVFPDAQPYSVKLNTGNFPVVLSVAIEENDQRVAFATIKFKSTEAKRWELMHVPSDDPNNLKQGEIFGYPVDSGTGCFMDRTAGEILSRKMREHPNYIETMMKEMDKVYVHTWSSMNISLDNANLIAFSSGLGDGLYATYAGYDASGDVCLAVTDFMLLDGDLV